MPFTLIKGTFHVVGYSPDGDSIKFMAKKAANWEKIKGKPRINKKGHVQLRIESIDALETHYQPKVKGIKSMHQPLEPAQAAREFLVASVGITNVEWGPTQRRVTKAEDGAEGYILTRAVDNNRYGRPVSFVFAGKAPKPDGTEVHLDPAWLRKSVNYQLLAHGHAYPTYYTSFFYDLRNEMTKAVAAARAKKLGIWKSDASMGFTFEGMESITDKYPIMPKLFRRLADHLAMGGDLTTFRDFLKAKKDGLWILPKAHHTEGMDYVTSVKVQTGKGVRVGLTVKPEEMVFDPQK